MSRRALVWGAVAAGGALGAAARWATSVLLLSAAGPGFPWGTLAVNVVGSFVIGLHAAVAGPGGRYEGGEVGRHFVQTGFCGGFTTFSAFALETLLIARTGAQGLAAVYVAASVPLWLAAVAAGWGMGARINRRR